MEDGPLDFNNNNNNNNNNPICKAPEYQKTSVALFRSYSDSNMTDCQDRITQ